MISAPDRITKSEYFLLCLLILVSSLLRFAFVLKGFGETDAANLAVSVIDYIAHSAHGLLTDLYFIDIVPLYVLYLQVFMKLLGNKYQHVLMIMNYTNAVVAALMIFSVYLFVRKLFHNSSVAMFSVLTFIFTPSVLKSSLYGFPHMLALFFLVTSLYFFLRWLDDTNYLCLFLSCVSLAACILLKSDLILGSGAYIGLMYMRKVKEKGKIASSFLVISLAFLSLLFIRHWMGIERGHTTSIPDFLELVTQYTGLLSSRSVFEMFKMQTLPILYAAGILNFAAGTIALLFYLFQRRADIIVFVLAWTGLPTVFWLLIYGNSARHNMISVLPFIMIIFLLIHQKFPRFTWAFSLICILGNFLIPYPTMSKGAGATDMLENQLQMSSRVQNIRSVAVKIAAIETDKIIIAPNVFRAYVYYEIISLDPEYEVAKHDIGSVCHILTTKRQKSMICSSLFDAEITDILAEFGLKEPAVIFPVSHSMNVAAFKEKGLKVYGYDRLKGSIGAL